MLGLYYLAGAFTPALLVGASSRVHKYNSNLIRADSWVWRDPVDPGHGIC